MSRDEIRFTNFTEYLDFSGEKLVTKLIDKQIIECINSNYNVILDNTHCKFEYIQEIINKHNSIADIELEIIDVDLNEALERNSKRQRKLSNSLIKKFYDDFIKTKEIIGKKIFYPKTNENNRFIKLDIDNNKPNCIIVDLDGTLALNENRDMFNPSEEEILQDELSLPVKMLVDSIKNNNSETELIFLSGREDKYYDVTKEWLNKYFQHEYKLFMRKTNDNRKDFIIKDEIYRNNIKDNHNVLFAVDDRKQVKRMWVNNNIFVFDVNQFDIEF